ncbi:MAG: iron ABC transporter permease, partial [Pseudomonadota bacterium]
ILSGPTPSIHPGTVLAILADQIGIHLPWKFTQVEETVLISIRAPRTLLGILVGSGLAVSGAAMQGMFRNPLADPALVGVSSGAGLAAVAAIVLGTPVIAGLSVDLVSLALPISAFIGGFLATFLVYSLALDSGRTDISTMLLAGIAVNAIAQAGIGLFSFLADDQQLRTLTFWLLGSLGGGTWHKLMIVAPFVIFPILILPMCARVLNAILLGEAEAGHLGFNLERVKLVLIICVAMCVGATVSMTGIIGFVGLVVPHLLRIVHGPDHRFLIPACAFLGAILLLAADLLARIVVAPAELPIGVITALVGGPFFIWLLLKRRTRPG